MYSIDKLELDKDREFLEVMQRSMDKAKAKAAAAMGSAGGPPGGAPQLGGMF